MVRIFVGNLSYQATEQDVRAAFERFGRVASVQLPTDRGTGRMRGIAFVAMPRFEDAEEAMTRLNGTSLGGRPLVVNVARENERLQRSAEANRFHLV
jgi:RNA recognition motif-containing protein